MKESQYLIIVMLLSLILYYLSTSIIWLIIASFIASVYIISAIIGVINFIKLRRSIRKFKK